MGDVQRFGYRWYDAILISICHNINGCNIGNNAGQVTETIGSYDFIVCDST